MHRIRELFSIHHRYYMCLLGGIVKFSFEKLHKEETIFSEEVLNNFSSTTLKIFKQKHMERINQGGKLFRKNTRPYFIHKYTYILFWSNTPTLQIFCLDFRSVYWLNKIFNHQTKMSGHLNNEYEEQNSLYIIPIGLSKNI